MGYDGSQFWIGGTPIAIVDDSTSSVSAHHHLERQDQVPTQQQLHNHSHAAPISTGDVIGCCVDLEKESVWFTKNGRPVKGQVKLFKECCDLLTPTVSFSSGTR